MMTSICDDCLKRRSCVIDSSANVQRCGMYVSESKYYEELMDKFSELIADKVVEKLTSVNMGIV